MVRAITRLPLPTVAREATGRMMADPGFVYKAVLEQVVTAGTALAWEASQRKDKLTSFLFVFSCYIVVFCYKMILWLFLSNFFTLEFIIVEELEAIFIVGARVSVFGVARFGHVTILLVSSLSDAHA